jgi:Protein of unknown function (DUF2380)
MHPLSSRERQARRSIQWSLSLLLLAAPAVRAQSTTGPEAPSARLAALSAALYNEQANVIEEADSAKAALATEVLRTQLAGHLGERVASAAAVDSLATAPAALEATGGIPCNVKVSCARMVAQRLDARWVVMTKVSKTSNLIWVLSAQLIRVETGEIILDDSTELKGEPEGMVRVGVRQFADRVARTVANGGRATNFPDSAFEAQAIANWPIQ